ncbi:MAG TPA: hypothetical protein VFQ54_04830, partial [Thermomicrobiales bacterium]|nr:hypothetical protein [Thermomicrobiales bacterium]
MDRRKLSGLLLVSLLFSLFARVGPVAAAPVATPDDGVTGVKSVTAKVLCYGSSKFSKQMIVWVNNNSSRPIEVVYVGGIDYGAPQNPASVVSGWNQAVEQSVAPGETITYETNLGNDSDKVFGGALVVTSRGILQPMCNEQVVHLWSDPGLPANNSEDAMNQEVTIAVTTIGQLESLRAYPALYAMMHPDSQAHLTVDTLSCWYAKQFGVPSDWKETVFTTTIDKLDIVNSWVWAPERIRYERGVAIVDITQSIGGIAKTQDVTSTLHLVESAGVWRWF